MEKTTTPQAGMYFASFFFFFWHTEARLGITTAPMSELLFVTFRKQLIKLLNHNDELFISTVGFPLSLPICVFEPRMKARGWKAELVRIDKETTRKSACLHVIMNNYVERKTACHSSKWTDDCECNNDIDSATYISMLDANVGVEALVWNAPVCGSDQVWFVFFYLLTQFTAFKCKH